MASVNRELYIYHPTLTPDTRNVLKRNGKDIRDIENIFLYVRTYEALN